MWRIIPFFMAPTELIDSGQRSRSSKIQGILFALESKNPAHVVKICGEVATIIWAGTKRPAQKEEKPKLA
jgi:hypothetical protein